MKISRAIWHLAGVVFLLVSLRAPGLQAAEAWLLDIDGAIGPATTDYVVRGIEGAAENGASLVILRLDTPGGLDLAMRDIIKSILSSPVPVVTWVTPKGARAASAGTYILYASHVAAMSPATNLGSATPVQIGAPELPSWKPPAEEGEKEKTDAKGDGGEDSETKSPAPGTAMERKVLNDAIAYIRGLAKLRGRNAEWAESAVRDAANLPSEEALEKQVIDLVATDLDDLLKQLDGRELSVGNGNVTLATADLTLHEVVPDWRNKFLATITDPNIAYILMLIGVYGLILEFYNPGGVVPGVIGGICLLLALYALQVLPVSYAGLGLILLGVVLMVAEALVPSFGILGFGGITAFVIGSVILMDTTLPAFKIALPIIAAVTVVSAGILILVLGMALRAQKQVMVSGSDLYVGEPVTAVADFADRGQVKLGGEIWKAQTTRPVQQGERLWVERVDGLTLHLTDNQSEDTA